MRLLALAALATLAPAGTASAALSGFHDSAEQIGAILASNAVADALRQMPIERLEQRASGGEGTRLWRIESEGCELDVRLRPLPSKGLGKITFEVFEVISTGHRNLHPSSVATTG